MDRIFVRPKSFIKVYLTELNDAVPEGGLYVKSNSEVLEYLDAGLLTKNDKGSKTKKKGEKK